MRLSRRNIKGIACGIAHKFNCSASYYAFQAITHRVQKVKIDLLKLEIVPKVFDVERNLILAGMCRYDLLRGTRGWDDLEIQTAELIVVFALDEELDGWVQSRAIVTVVDECGKKWIGSNCRAVMIDYRERG